MAQTNAAQGAQGRKPAGDKNSGKRGYQAPSIKRGQKLAQVTGAVKVTGGAPG